MRAARKAAQWLLIAQCLDCRSYRRRIELKRWTQRLGLGLDVAEILDSAQPAAGVPTQQPDAASGQISMKCSPKKGEVYCDPIGGLTNGHIANV